MDYFDRYHKTKDWYSKVILIEIYHISKKDTVTGWTVTQTAAFFGVSIGLASENLALAESFHRWPELIKCESRNKALKQMNELVRQKTG